MAGVIVDLDRPVAAGRARPADRAVIAALALAGALFALMVWLARPDGVPSSAVDPAMATPTERLALARPATRMTVISRADAVRDLGTVVLFVQPDVVLSSIPDRLLNEAGPAALRAVIRVRGALGLASVEQPWVIMWTEDGITYWLTSPTHTTDELIRLADTLP